MATTNEVSMTTCHQCDKPTEWVFVGAVQDKTMNTGARAFLQASCEGHRDEMEGGLLVVPQAVARVHEPPTELQDADPADSVLFRKRSELAA